MTNTELLKTAILASIEASNEILDVYSNEFSVEIKDDNSPLTKADQRAHEAIMKRLQHTGIPVLSEEGKEIPFSSRMDWNRLWIVDPLDGTKEFIKRNGEFTVNIALVESGYPVLGVIFVPVTGDLFYGLSGFGAKLVQTRSVNEENSTWFEELNAAALSLPHSPKIENMVRIVASRSHMSPETEEFIRDQEMKHGKVELVSMGSSLKICLVAEGKADLYPRFAPTMEWDTAAGQAIAEASGKSFVNYRTGKRMDYNRENLRNDWFLVS